MLLCEDILFNPLKHHRGFVSEVIGKEDADELSAKMKSLGNCQLDFYYGCKTVDDVQREILYALQLRGIFTHDRYKKWLVTSGGYRSCEISDGSKWILRMGRAGRAFIHIHPSRNSPHSVRISANALKTAIALCSVTKQYDLSSLTIDAINAVRFSFLSLSPVKESTELKAVERIMKIITGIPLEVPLDVAVL